MQPDLVDGELYLAPNFPAPPNTDYLGYHNYIDEMMPPESPYLYGLHPNAEIGFLTTTSESLFRTVFEMQPRFELTLLFFYLNAVYVLISLEMRELLAAQQLQGKIK